MLLRESDLEHSWLLGRGERLEGMRIANVKLRPVRAALLIPERNTAAAAAAVEACCISWGGFANCIVPYSETEGIGNQWRKIVEVLDPDLFVCFEDQPPKEVEGYLKGKGNLHVFSYGSYKFETLVAGTLVYSAFDAFMDPRDVERKNRPLVLPLYRGFPEVSLPFLARYGSMLETTGYRDEKYLNNIPRRETGRLNATHRDFFDIRECKAGDHYHHEVPKMISEVFVGDLGRLLPGEDDAEASYSTLPGSTLAGLTPMTQVPWGDPESLVKSRQYDGRVVVLGDYNSVEDLALFWTLRGQRPGKHPFPIWLPYRNVYDDQAKHLVESASRKLGKRGRGGGGRLHITSASLSLEYMQERFGEVFPDADITIDIAHFFGGTTDYYAVEQQQPVSFRAGTAYVQRIRPPKMEGFHPDLDHVVHEVEIEGVRLPAVEAVERVVYGPSNRGNPILTAKGAIRSVDPHKPGFRAKDFLEVRLPDGWGLLEAFFEHHGYECTATAKSQAALGQMALLGGVEGLNVVANSKVFRAVKGLCATSGRGEGDLRPYRADRKAEAYNYFTKAFGHQHARPILRWLVENRLLLRGADIECPRCRLKLWYAVDRIGERWTCDGCREEMPIPVKPDAVHWKYRINELWANGQDQGTVTPLLAIYAMHAKWGSSFAREGFGYYPGLDLKKRDGASVPVDHIEVDLFALWGGRPVLVECKESAEHLAEPAKAEELKEQLADQSKLAEHIGARKLIVASPSRFPEDKSILTGRLPPETTVNIEWWDEDTLLDPLYFGEDLRANDPEKWHLEWLSRTLDAPEQG